MPSAVLLRMCYSGNDHRRRFNMNIEQVGDIAEAAFKARFPGIGIVVNVKLGLEHYDEAMVNAKIIYDDKGECLIVWDTMAVWRTS